MRWIENQLIFFPTPYPEGDWHPREFQFEDAWITTEDGVKIHGWHFPRPSPRAVILIAHGNAGNVATWAPMGWVYRHLLGAAVLLFDYRGYGRSEGSPDELGILRDGRAARRWLAERNRVPERDVALVGRSLGGAVVVDLAAKDGAAALVLESTFTSLPDVAAAHFSSVVKFFMQSRLDSLSKISRYHGPLLMSHGDQDEIVPFEQGERLFAAAHEPKTFVALRGVGHNDAPPEEYYQALVDFFAPLPAPTPE